MERLIKALAALLLVSLSFSSCAYMTKSGRQQMTYRNYVNQNIRERQRERRREIALIKKAERHKLKAAVKNAPPSQLKINATADSSEPVANSETFSPVTATETAPPEP